MMRLILFDKCIIACFFFFENIEYVALFVKSQIGTDTDNILSASSIYLAV